MIPSDYDWSFAAILFIQPMCQPRTYFFNQKKVVFDDFEYVVKLNTNCNILLYCVECPQYNIRLEAPGCLYVACAEAYLRTKWHLDPSSHLATIDTGRELGADVPLMGAELGSRVTQCVWDEAYLHIKWHLDPSSRLTTIDMSQKVGGGCCAPFYGSPYNIMSPGTRPISVPVSGILIHLAVWLQQTWCENVGPVPLLGYVSI